MSPSVKRLILMGGISLPTLNLASRHDYRFLTYSDTGGTTPITSGSVAAWGDMVTGQLHTQGTAAAQPTLGASGLSFDGGDSLSLLSPSGYPTGNVPVTMYIFCLNTSTGIRKSTRWGNTILRSAFSVGIRNSTTNVEFSAIGDDLTVSTSGNQNTLMAAVQRYDPTGTLLVGNVLGASGQKTLGGAMNFGTASSELGSFNAASEFWVGLILGRLIYSTYHNAAQVNQVLRWANQQYAIPYYPVAA